MTLGEALAGALVTQAAIILVLFAALRVFALRRRKRRVPTAHHVVFRWPPTDFPNTQRAESAAWLNALISRLAVPLATAYGAQLRALVEQAVAAAYAGLAEETPRVAFEELHICGLALGGSVPRVLGVRTFANSIAVDAEWRGERAICECVVETGVVLGVLGVEMAVLPVRLHVSVLGVRLRAVFEFSGPTDAPSVSVVLPRGRFSADYVVRSAVGSHVQVVDVAHVERAVHEAVRRLLDKHLLSPNCHVLHSG